MSLITSTVNSIVNRQTITYTQLKCTKMADMVDFCKLKHSKPYYKLVLTAFHKD